MAVCFNNYADSLTLNSDFVDSEGSSGKVTPLFRETLCADKI